MTRLYGIGVSGGELGRQGAGRTGPDRVFLGMEGPGAAALASVCLRKAWLSDMWSFPASAWRGHPGRCECVSIESGLQVCAHEGSPGSRLWSPVADWLQTRGPVGFKPLSDMCQQQASVTLKPSLLITAQRTLTGVLGAWKDNPAHVTCSMIIFPVFPSNVLITGST